MKNIITFSILLFLVFGYSQEFSIHDNGMIYSSLSMKKLSAIVGDKNSEFRQCELTKDFKSIYQAKGIFFKLETSNRKELKKELTSNICFADFFEKYETEKNIYWRLITKSNYTNYDDERMIHVREVPNGETLSIPENNWEKSILGNWIFDFSDKDEVTIVYIQEAFEKRSLPEKYARMIQYSECMIDTTTQVFTEDAVRGSWRNDSEVSSKKQDKFIKYINENYPVKMPKYPSGENVTTEEYIKADQLVSEWEITKKQYIKSHLATREVFCEFLNDAYLEAKKHKNSDDEFENYVAMLMSNEYALQLKRNRIVVGSCSMDQSPRIHAMNIAQLSAESFNWDVFLRSHLNIMNDKVNRVSDGSWAWETRSTYIKELEELNIEVLDLMFGISLRIDNPVEGHYYGDIRRVGRAISESKYVDAFENNLILAIADDELDDYNRLIMYYLYENLEFHKDKSKKKGDYNRNIKEAIMLLPKYIRLEDS